MRTRILADVRIEDSVRLALRNEKIARVKKMRLLYLFFLFPLINLIIFRYVPIYGIIDTFVYRDGLLGRNYEISTVAGVFKNAIGVALLLSTNAVIKRFNEYGIW